MGQKCAHVHCTNHFTPNPSRPTHKFCSRRCSQNAKQWRNRQRPEVAEAERQRFRRRYNERPEFRQRILDRNYLNLSGVEYAEKLLANRRRKALGRLSERQQRSEERSEGG